MSNKNERLQRAIARVAQSQEPWESVQARAREALQRAAPIKPLKRPTVELDAEGRPLPLPQRDRLSGATGRPVDGALVDARPQVDPVTGREKFRGRKMAPPALAEAYRHRAPLALDVLTKICTQYLRDDPRVSAAEAAKAAQLLTDRAYGRAPEVVQVQAAERDARLVLRPSEMSTEDLVTYAQLLGRNRARLLAGRKFDSTGRLVVDAEVSAESAPSEPDPKSD